jgi:hypothetical protein
VRSRLVIATAALVVLYIVMWFNMVSEARFLMPALVVMSALAGLAVERLLARGRAATGLALAALAASVLFWLPVGLQPIATRMPVALGYQDPANYIEQRTGTYRAFRELAGSAEGTVISIGYPMILWYPERAIAFGSTLYEIDLRRRELWPRLRSDGVTNVIVAGGGYVAWIEPLRTCIEEVERVKALNEYEFTSEGIPITLTLYSLERCQKLYAGL